MKKTRFKIIAVVVLVLTAVVGLVLAGPGRGGYRPRGGPEFDPNWTGRFGMGMGRLGGHGEQGMQRMLGGLELTDEQKKSVKQITEAAKEKNQKADKVVGEARKALHEAVVKGDETTIRQAATNLGKVLGDQAVLKAQTMASIKAVLTPEQLQKLEELKATMKERAGKFREEMGAGRFHRGFERFGRPRDSWERLGEHHGFGPYGRDPNVVAPIDP